MKYAQWKWITSANLFRWLSSDKTEELRQAHQLTDKKLAEAWLASLARPNDADILTLEAATRFYASVNPIPNHDHPTRIRRDPATHQTNPRPR